jgi:IS1 family transposase
VACLLLALGASSESVVFIGNNPSNVAVSVHFESKPNLPWFAGRRGEYVSVFDTPVDVGVRAVPTLAENPVLVSGSFSDTHGFISLIELRIFCVKGRRRYWRDDYFHSDFFLYDPCWTPSFVGAQQVDIHSSSLAGVVGGTLDRGRVNKEYLPLSPLYVDNDPSTFTVDKSIGARLSRIGRCFLQRDAVLHGFSSPSGLFGLLGNSQKSQENSPSCRPVRPSEKAIPTWQVPFGIGYVLLGMIGIRYSGNSKITALFGFLCGLLGGAFILNGYVDCQPENKPESKQVFQHSGTIVPQKYLTRSNYWGTVIDMANVLNTDKKIAVIGALAEGSSIRSIERITGVHRDTIMRLGVKVGQGCASVMDSKMRNLPCHRLEMDEIWGFVGKKDRNVRVGEDAVGSVWTFCAIDAETKLGPAFKVGDRSVATAKAFVQDVAGRMAYRVQISTDGLNAYVAAMESAFGGNVDYAQIIKTYGREETTDNRRYSAPEFVSSEKIIHVGNPDVNLISTSYVERLNATTRLHMRRLTRLTLAFSKKRENFEAAVALHFAYYNFVKRHNTLRCTPAMAAGVANSFWGVGDLVEAAA